MKFAEYAGIKIALSKRYLKRYPQVGKDDIMGEVEVAWVEATKAWDGREGVKFSTFAWTLIDRALNAYCTANVLPATIDVKRAKKILTSNPIYYVELEENVAIAEDTETLVEKKRVYERMRSIMLSLPNGPSALDWLLSDDATVAEVADQHVITTNQVRHAVSKAKEQLAEDIMLREYVTWAE